MHDFFLLFPTMAGILGGSIPSSGFSLFIVFVPGCIRATCSDKQLLKRLESVKKEVQPYFFRFVALPVMVQRVLHPYI